MSSTTLKQQHYATSGLVIGYALCSSLLAIINKYAITQFNYPGLLTALQYLTSSLGVYLLDLLPLFLLLSLILRFAVNPLRLILPFCPWLLFLLVLLVMLLLIRVLH
ncbi:hypothetical protein MtrunA17_Chr4g0063001 [Medicago truncatula]|uniref:Transmembrane protein n=1 Tax=Medicago truncatula TaxID=3880 RepID=A0A396IGV6_MEDTR|nr:hypothetical protein MtrunA17_Chr4g0063001 [Medicago truncatula]